MSAPATPPHTITPAVLTLVAELSHRPTFRANYLNPALDRDLIERTIPDKPNSRLQKYRLTTKGRAFAADR